jgi:hypothetical protein
MVVVVRLMNLLDDRYFGGGKIVVDEFIKKIESLKGSAIVRCRRFNVEQKSSRSMSRWFVSVLVPNRSTITARPPSWDRAFA